MKLLTFCWMLMGNAVLAAVDVNVTPGVPKSKMLYSANADQFPANAHLTPPPMVHPDGVVSALATVIPPVVSRSYAWARFFRAPMPRLTPLPRGGA
jgi:hypothetical protein